MDHFSNVTTDNRWIEAYTTNHGAILWPDYQTTSVTTGQVSNIWCDDHTQQPAELSDNGIHNSLIRRSSLLPRPYPGLMSGPIAQSQSTPNASSVYLPSRLPTQAISRQWWFTEAHRALEDVEHAYWRHSPPQIIDASNGISIDSGGAVTHSLDLVIRELRRSVQDKNDLIQTLKMQLENKNSTKQGKKRPPNPAFASESSNFEVIPVAIDPRVASGKRRRFGESARKKTAETRKCGACVRCRRLKKRCNEDPLQPCDQCTGLDSIHQRIACVRTRVIQIVLHRTGTTDNDTWTKRREISDLRNLNTFYQTPPFTIELTQGFGPSLKFQVRSFAPEVDTETSYLWTSKDGIPQWKRMPNYAISELDSARIELRNYVECDRHMNSYLESHLDMKDFLLWETFKRAQASTSQLLQKTLKLWLAARLIEKPWNLCGDETLGELVVDDTASPWHGTIPIPPIMDTQIDQIVIQDILLPLRKEVLQLLQAKFDKFQMKDWFEIFATVFILLNTIEIATKHDHDFANFYGHVSHGRTRFEDYQLVESYFHSAQVLISHFRDAPRGHIPLLQNPTTPGKGLKMREVDVEAADFMCKLREYLDNPDREREFDKLSTGHSYETPLYWGCQLVARTWEGNPITIQEKS